MQAPAAMRYGRCAARLPSFTTLAGRRFSSIGQLPRARNARPTSSPSVCVARATSSVLAVSATVTLRSGLK